MCRARGTMGRDKNVAPTGFAPGMGSPEATKAPTTAGSRQECRSYGPRLSRQECRSYGPRLWGHTLAGRDLDFCLVGG